MIRFLITLLIFGAIIWGIWSFFSPLNQLTRSLDTSKDEYTDFLVEAIERNNPDIENVGRFFTQDKKNVKSAEEDPNTTPSTDGSSISTNNTRESLGNPAFANREFYKNSYTHTGYTGNMGIPDELNSKVETSYDPCLHWEENRGYFGTPPIPRTQIKTQSYSNQPGGLIFDPPIKLPSFPDATGKMMYGKYTVIRDFNSL